LTPIRTSWLADQRERHAEQHSEEQHLQHVVARQCVERGRRDDVEDEAADAAALHLVGVVGVGVERLGVEQGGIDVHAVAGREDEGEQQADAQRDRRHHLEIDQCLEPDPADLLEVAGAGDAVDHHAKDDRRDDHRDQLEEAVAQDLQAGREVRCRDAQGDPEDQCDDDLEEQGPVERRADGRSRYRDGGHGALRMETLGRLSKRCARIRVAGSAASSLGRESRIKSRPEETHARHQPDAQAGARARGVDPRPQA
jgi:hypothetical protein